jgi:hypothetical protein
MNNWKASPKKEFDRRRLERCWNLPIKDTTYRNKGVGRKEEIKVKQTKETPYWNFWRAVFAGWLIRYPGQIFKGIGTLVLFMVFMVFLSVSPIEQEPSTGYNDNVPSVSE